MKEQNLIKEIVKYVLTVDEFARDNNDRLYLAVICIIARNKGISLNNHNILVFLTNRKAWGFPTYESVTRARRKWQEKDPSLRASDNVEAMREIKEKEYKEWAIAN